jgi:TorA maturation chaperone TorD
MYHGPLVGGGGPERPLYMALWVEGLATLVARQLNPSASDVAIHGLPTNTPERAARDLPRLTSLLRAKLDSTKAEDYQAFFLGNETDAPIPRRSGYYVGYLVAARIQKGRSLRELARLKGPELRQAIEVALAAPAELAKAAVPQ